jgi:hypothetical protein
MPGLENITTLTAIASGTLNINVAKLPASLASITSSIVRISGTAALTGNLNISPSGTPEKNTAIKILWEASVTITPATGNKVIIFGENVPDELVGKNFIAECVYDGSGGPWTVNILPDFAGAGIVAADRLAADAVTTAKIADDTVTLAKMAGLAKGKIIYGDASGNPADIELGSADGRMLLGDTTAGVAAVDMSGDATLTKAGALTIANNAVTTAKILDANVTAEKLSANTRKDSFSIKLDYDAASKLGGQIFLPVCYNCTVNSIKLTLLNTAASTLTNIFKNAGGTVMTGSQIDVPAATGVGNVITSTVTGNNVITAGTNMIIEPSAAGALGGQGHIIFCVTRDN